MFGKKVSYSLSLFLIQIVLLCFCRNVTVAAEQNVVDSETDISCAEGVMVDDDEMGVLCAYFQALANCAEPPEDIVVSSSVRKKWEELSGGDAESLRLTNMITSDSYRYLVILQEYPSREKQEAGLWYHLLKISQTEKGIAEIEEDVLLDYDYETGFEDAVGFFQVPLCRYRENHPVSLQELSERKEIAVELLTGKLELSEEEQSRLASSLEVIYDESLEEDLLPGILITDSFLLHDSMTETGKSQENWMDSTLFRIGYKKTEDSGTEDLLNRLFSDETEFYDVYVTNTDGLLTPHIVLFYDYSQIKANELIRNYTMGILAVAAAVGIVFVITLTKKVHLKRNN